jgi:O-antigen ligase
MHDVQLGLGYLGVTCAAFEFARGGRQRALLAGTACGMTIVAGYALVTRLFPGRLVEFDSSNFGYRLSSPITYWNGLGAFAAMGLLLTVVSASSRISVRARAAAAAAVPVFASVLYFTYSRGGWFALGCGTVVVLVLAPNRLRLIAAAVVPVAGAGLAVLWVERANGLNEIGATESSASSDGHRAAVALVALCVLSAAATAAFCAAERRVHPPRWIRPFFVAASLLAAVAFLAFGVSLWGSPVHAAHRLWNEASAAPATHGSQGEQRLFSLSSNGRIELWRVALHRFEAHPVDGTGSGTYWVSWTRSGIQIAAHDAHSLYLQTLSELGLIGLGLLAGALTAPFVVVWSRRNQWEVVAAVGAYAVLIVHAAFDWDWQLMGVTTPALLAAIVILSASPPREPRSLRGARTASLVYLVLALAALPQLLADTLITRAEDNLQSHSGATLSDARRAERLAFWSSEPLMLVGDAYRVRGNDRAAAMSYRRAIEKDRSNWQLWMRWASVSPPEQARSRLRVARRLNPSIPAG